MSSEALAWAFKQDVKPSGAKFTLVALCECANYKTGRITPSIAHLVEITGQNRKSIIAHIDQLERQGFIADTGERTGRTMQIKVYEAHLGTVPKTEPSLNRNSSNNSVKQSQKRDTEPSLEPSIPDNAYALSPPLIEIPETPSIKPENFVQVWNEEIAPHGKRAVREFGPERRTLVKARMAQNGADACREVLANIRGSPFLMEAKGIQFDWVIQKKNFIKILEGNYNG